MSSSGKRRTQKISPSGIPDLEDDSTSVSDVEISSEQKPKRHSRKTLKDKTKVGMQNPPSDEGRTKKKSEFREKYYRKLHGTDEKARKIRENYYRTLGHEQYQEAYERDADWLRIKKELLKMNTNQRGGRKTLRKKRKGTTRKKKN